MIIIVIMIIIGEDINMNQSLILAWEKVISWWWVGGGDIKMVGVSGCLF